MSTTKTPVKSASNKPKRRRPFVSLDGRLTVEQWAALPDTKPRYELIDGILVQKMTTTTAHAWAAGQFLFQCMTWGQTQGWTFLPEGTGVKSDEYNGAVPDVVGFAPDYRLAPEATYHERPFLIAEVLSPGTAKIDRTRKKEQYARGGVALYIIIDTRHQTIEVHRLENDAYGAPDVLSGSDVWQPAELPGLRLELARLWMD